MSKPLVVVESPTKVKTIKKYLGKDYNIAATVGHIKDLPTKEMGIDIEKDFAPQYRQIPGKQKVIRALKKEAGNAEDIYLAPDPDREGEAIAFHTIDILKKKGRRFHRVLFHELTRKAVQEAIAAPQELNLNKYEAQQARRILDRLVGYEISPLLWRKVKRGLSAGRVQSVAVRIICERERAIQAFDPEEYWSITAMLAGILPPQFSAKLAKKGRHKIKIPDQAACDQILKELHAKPPKVSKIIFKTTKRNPAPPFTTSKLQQESIRRLSFSGKKTMILAQQLYEGIELSNGESEGLITYMRTDSTRIAMEAAEEALSFIKDTFGKEYTLEQPRFFKNKKKVQDAHEAIRPTSVLNTPEKVKPFLNKDQAALYQLIWQRFTASQMAVALINNNSIRINVGDYQFNASGSTIKFPGFMSVYMTTDTSLEDQKNKMPLPELKQDEVLKLLQYDPKQHFTAPPPRFSEASLVKELEEKGIGRPSTYTSIISTIQGKEYVEKNKTNFNPTELGYIVNDLVVTNFPELFNIDFTAKMENDLDRIEGGEINYLQVLSRFYDPFKSKVEAAGKNMLSVKGVGFAVEIECPECKKQLHIKYGKNGPFLACGGYPECSFSCDYTRDQKGRVELVPPVSDTTDKICELCGKPMVVKRGRYGVFIACSGYPECRQTLSMNSDHKTVSIGIKCPEKGCSGDIMERQSKRGKVFYGCSNFPQCKFAIWDKPVKICSQCSSLVVAKSSKKKGEWLACINKECDYLEN